MKKFKINVERNSYMRGELRKRISNRLRKLRESFGDNFVEMGKRFDVADSTWHRYESGQRAPGIVVMEKLLLEHDISIDWLFFNHGPQKAGEKGDIEKQKQMAQRIEELERELESRKQGGESESKALRFLRQYEEQVGPFPDPAEFKPEMLQLLDEMRIDRRMFFEMMLAYEKAKKET